MPGYDRQVAESLKVTEQRMQTVAQDRKILAGTLAWLGCGGAELRRGPLTTAIPRGSAGGLKPEITARVWRTGRNVTVR